MELSAVLTPAPEVGYVAFNPESGGVPQCHSRSFYADDVQGFSTYLNYGWFPVHAPHDCLRPTII